MAGPPSDFDDLRFHGSRTAFLFEGKKRAGIDISMFVVRTPPGGSVELHTHPYSETFVMLEGEGRSTACDEVVELRPDTTLVGAGLMPATASTPARRRSSSGSVHESGHLDQTFLGIELLDPLYLMTAFLG